MDERQQEFSEVRVISVGALRCGAWALGLVSFGMTVIYFVANWASNRGDGRGHDSAAVVMYAMGLAGLIFVTQLRGLASGRMKTWRRRDAVAAAILLPAYAGTIGMLASDPGRHPAWLTTVPLLGIAAAGAVLAGMWWRDQWDRKAGRVCPVGEPVAHRRIVGASGTVDVRVGVPGHGAYGWETEWSVCGAPSGDVRAVAYGQDPMSSLLIALAMAGDCAGDADGLLHSVPDAADRWSASVSLSCSVSGPRVRDA